jgi:peptide/nickel transport system substrate-binding protein
MSGMRARASALMLLLAMAGTASAQPFVETPMLADKVAAKQLPPVAERLPKTPYRVEFEGGRSIGKHGGDIVSLISRARDIRYLSAVSYARLVGYDAKLNLRPDILEKVENEGDRVFTFTLREGHRWSDGEPFTADDFRYYWDEVAHDKELSPGGLPEFLLVEGKEPRFEVIDARTVRYTWEKPNPRFLPTLAQPRDPFIYRPAHYLSKSHPHFVDKATLNEMAKKEKLKSWAQLHNRLDDMFENTNPNLPTLQPWRPVTKAPANRFVFERNPYYHRVDRDGQQLPYVDRILLDVASAGLMAAKANSGEVDLLFRGLNMGDIPILKEGEKAHNYRTLLWPTARGSEIALYPNLNTTDPVWRALNRDVRFRRALSLAIDRRMLNNALLFGLGTEGNDTISEDSPLFEKTFRTTNAEFDPATASRLLDEIGLTRRNGAGIRLLPDGRELEIIVETDGDGSLVVDGLTLVAEFWRDIGVKLFTKPQDRTVLRNRTYSGGTVMVAAQGLDLALATAEMSPAELAPTRQDNYSWPRWGQFYETKGSAGENCDIPEAMDLMRLYKIWLTTSDDSEHRRIWKEMLANHAKNQWSIGTVAGAIQPIVVKGGLLNLPQRAVYTWEPTSMLGVYRIDALYWDRNRGREASVPWRLLPAAAIASPGSAASPAPAGGASR